MPTKPKTAPQTHQANCYCQNRRCCQTPSPSASVWQQRTTPAKSSATSVISSARLKPKPNAVARERFVKMRSSGGVAAQMRLGLGHSQHSNNDYSRRNSAATTISGSGTTTSTAAAAVATGKRSGMQQQRTAAMQTTAPLMPSTGYEYTAQRSYYERAQEELQSFWLARNAAEQQTVSAMLQQRSPIVDERFLALQQFRLQNLNDCFSAQRQNELKMQTYAPAQPNEWHDAQQQQQQQQQQLWLSVKPCHKVEQTARSDPKVQSRLGTLTPYAVRQRLLKQRLEMQQNEHSRPRLPGGSRLGTLDKSLALRFQETY